MSEGVEVNAQNREEKRKAMDSAAEPSDSGSQAVDNPKKSKHDAEFSTMSVKELKAYLTEKGVVELVKERKPTEKEELIKLCEAVKFAADPDTSDENITCGVCLQLLAEPTKLPCEHRFCQTCCFLALRQSSSACPLCRHEVPRPRKLEEVVIDIDEAARIQSVAGEDACAVRLEQIVAVKEQIAEREGSAMPPKVPLFYMGDFEGSDSTRIPIHFFEPRYRMMANMVIEGQNNGRFGMICQGPIRPGARGWTASFEQHMIYPSGVCDALVCLDREFVITEVEAVEVHEGAPPLIVGTVDYDA
eukprot:m.6528 g.6528  ORF g.6528 m.6528 type:complete len:303 (+) comp3547_c0_seq1:288-1196(+)